MENDDLNQIERLFALKGKGALSHDEFMAEKARIFAQFQERSASYEDAIRQPDADDQSMNVFEKDWQGAEIGNSRFGADSGARIMVGAVMAMAVIGGGLFYWQQSSKRTYESAVPVTQPSISAAAAAPAPSPVTPKPSEATLLKLAFAATIGSQASGYQPQKLLPISAQIYAVIATGQGGEAHADPGRFAVQYARRDGNEFVASSVLHEVETGTFGQEPVWTIRHDLSTDPLIFVEGGGTWQGCSSMVATIVELSRTGPKEIGSVPMGYEFENEIGITSQYTGTFEQGADGIQVRYTGSTEAVVPLYIHGGSIHPQMSLPAVC